MFLWRYKHFKFGIAVNTDSNGSSSCSPSISNKLLDKSKVETDLFNSSSQISETDLSLLLERSNVDSFYNFYKFSTTFMLFDDKLIVTNSTFSFNPSIF